ncbi:MAG: discoidin domain-containing protein [Clostridia bacterium]|nr:discoidin domain-containing protein [Clostridia bacterium]
MKYTRRIKCLSMLLALLLTATMLPAVFSFAAEEEARVDAQYEAALTKEAGNLAISATVISQYGAHDDANWEWHVDNLHDGTTNYTDNGSKIGNGGYHSNPHIQVNNAGLGAQKHTEWVGYDLGAPTAINTVVIYPCRDEDGICHSFPNTLDIDVSTNGTDWMTVYHAGDIKTPEFGPQTFSFEEVTARYVRVNVLGPNPDYFGMYYVKFSEIAVYALDNAEPYCPNLATDATVTSSPHHADGSVWQLFMINDGNRYNFSTTVWDYGQYVGWHTSTQVPLNEDAYIAFDLGEKTKVDRVVVHPATERWKYGVQGDGSFVDNLALPTSIKIEASDDGVTWSELTVLSEMPAVYEPITLNFTPVEAQHIRVYMTRTNHIKLSEIEIYDTSVQKVPGQKEELPVVTTPDVNLALNGKVVFSNQITSGSWTPNALNNGIVDVEGGFTSAGTESAWVGYEFDTLVTVNKLVLYSAAVFGDDYGVWSGIPKVFTVDYSTDGLNWTTVATVTNPVVPEDQNALTVSFEPVNAKIIRINGTSLYPKASDGGRTYIQLAEMEAWYIEDATELSSENAISAYLQSKPATDSEGNVIVDTSDLRLVLVGNLEKLSGITSATVTVTFDLVGGGTKTLTRVLGGAGNQYSLYKSITAAGEVYTAAEGCVIFGNVITDIPNGDYTAITIEIVDNNDASNVIYQGYTG